MSAIPPSAQILQNYEISESDFQKKFCNAKQIREHEYEYSEGRSITSCGIEDSITLFAIEKMEGNKNFAVMGWHFKNPMTVDEIKEGLDETIYGDKNHELYLIGGNDIPKDDALLQKIHEAIDQFFTKKPLVIKELLNLNGGTKSQSISANIQLNGTLTLCFH